MARPAVSGSAECAWRPLTSRRMMAGLTLQVDRTCADISDAKSGPRCFDSGPQSCP